MSYREFRLAVFERAGWRCEVLGCDAEPTSVHHLVKVSRYRRLREDMRVGLATCGRCHTEIERREREDDLGSAAMVPRARAEEAIVALQEVYGVGSER